jgi:hypothetical protein
MQSKKLKSTFLPVQTLILLVFTLILLVHDAQATPSYVSPSHVTVRMYRLVSPAEADQNPLLRVGEIHPSGALCSAQSIVYGCTAFINNVNYPYPYENDNSVLVAIETDYLLDVVSQEMGSEGFHPNARHAQAIVARSYAYHRELFDSYTGTPVMDNSTASQVFIPYRFEKWDNESNFSPNYYDPCYTWSYNLLPQQKRICNAVDASNNYVTGINHVYDLPEAPLFGNNAPAFTMYFADTYNYSPTATLTEPSTVPGTNPPRHVYPYLVGVVDSVSSDPNVPTEGHRYGMSQKGASRWANGNMGWQGNLNRWSVQYNDVEHILVHYYTRINLREQSGSRVTPDYRWNPLEINWGTSDRQPPRMFHGTSYPITVRVQNTGLYDWTCSPYGYQNFSLRYKWTKGSNTTISSNSVSVCDLQTGDPSPLYNLTVGNIPNWGSGTYGLHFDIDVDAANPDDDFGFSYEGWPTYTILVCVGSEPCGDIFMPIVTKSE